LNRYYEIFVDLADEPGAIASIATLLAVNSINIKNIGIVHNREFEQGVLRIETYDEEAEKKAITILSDHAYKIYLRH
jgi:prephenate dehydrogenase